MSSELKIATFAIEIHIIMHAKLQSPTAAEVGQGKQLAGWAWACPTRMCFRVFCHLPSQWIKI